VDYSAGRLDEARDHFRSARLLFREMAIAWGEGSGVTGLAWVALGSGDTTAATHLLDDADTIWTSCGPWFRALGLYLRAVLAMQAQNPHAALRLTRESLSGIRSFQDTFAFAYALGPLLGAAGLLNDDAWVARIAGARDAFTDRTGGRAVDPLTDSLCAHTEEAASTRLGPERWAAAYAMGRRLSINGILAEIDVALQEAV
jgi:hypothetical protein